MLERSDGGHTPERLDRARILTAAWQIVAQQGLEALTMRRIGKELGVDPTAVYRHFRNKQEILTCLAEWIFDNEPEYDPQASWQEQFRIWVAHSFARYHAHPDLGLLLARQEDDLKPLVDLREALMGLLVNRAGLTLADAVMMEHMIETHVVGSGLFFAVSGFPEEAADYGDRMRRAFTLLSADEYPLVTAATPLLFPDPKEVFDHMTELLIEAVERMGQATPKEMEQ
jgi:AcrR family transcriptional regulator